MLGIKVQLTNAQTVKHYLLEHNLFDKRFAIKRESSHLIFPVTREFSQPFDFEADFVQTDSDERPLAQSLRDAMKPLLAPSEQELFIGSYDIVGSIAIVEIPDELAQKEQLIGQKLMEINRSVKTVLKKVGGHEGVFRTQRMLCVAGEDTRETTVTENGIKLRVNVETAYYSIRMATERKRILAQIRPGERVLCLFSGIGPYPITFSAHSRAAEVVGVEINPAAHELAVENVAKNRCTNVRLFCGDAHEIIPKLSASGERFDRITMPLPHSADEFLDDVMTVSKPGTTIHFYAFLDDNAFNKHVPLLRDAAQRHGFVLARYDVVYAGQHAPRVSRICIDAQLQHE